MHTRFGLLSFEPLKRLMSEWRSIDCQTRVVLLSSDLQPKRSRQPKIAISSVSTHLLILEGHQQFGCTHSVGSSVCAAHFAIT